MTFYEIKASADSAEIMIYDKIGKDLWTGKGVEAKQFIQDIKALGNLKNITLRINSPGGAVFDGNAIYNYLKEHKANKKVIIDGLAASIASVIAMAGDTIEMPENAMLMIHDPYTIAAGSSEDFRKAADTLDKIKSGIISAYQAKSGMEQSILSQMMTDETWMTADEALKNGFADKVTAPSQMAAAVQNFDLSGFLNVPESLIKAVKESVEDNKTPATEPVENLLEDNPQPIAEAIGDPVKMDKDTLKKDHPEVYNAIIKEGAEAERNRIKDVEDQLLPGHEALVNKLKYDGVSTGDTVARAILQAEKETRSKVITNLKEDAPKPATVVSEKTDANTVDPNLPVEDRAKAEWQKNPAIRDEFPTLEAFTAYLKASESGMVHIKKG